MGLDNHTATSAKPSTVGAFRALAPGGPCPTARRAIHSCLWSAYSRCMWRRCKMWPSIDDQGPLVTAPSGKSEMSSGLFVFPRTARKVLRHAQSRMPFRHCVRTGVAGCDAS